MNSKNDDLLIETLTQETTSRSISLICDQVETQLAQADSIGFAALSNLLLTLHGAPKSHVEKLLPYEKWIMALFEKFPQEFAADSNLKALAQNVFIDPWSHQHLRGTALWGKGFVNATGDFHSGLLGFLRNKYGIGVLDEERWGEGAELKTWVRELFYQAKKKRSHAAALAAITVLSLGPDPLNDVMTEGMAYASKLDFKKKSWNQEFALRALEELAKTLEGGTEITKQLLGPEDFKSALEALWLKALATEAETSANSLVITKMNLEALRAFALLKIAFGECPYPVLSVLKRRFPGGFVF